MRYLWNPLIASLCLAGSAAGATAPTAPATQARPARVVSAGSVQERAAQEAEASATDLEAVATRLEALAKEATLAAREARAKAIEARRRADGARKSALQLNPAASGEAPQLGQVPGSILRAAEEREVERTRELDGGASREAETQPRSGARRRGDEGDDTQVKAIPIERDKHAAATRTADENKAMYFKLLRSKHDAGPPKTVRQETFTFPPGAAPDMADFDIRAKWQWGINVARGQGNFQGPGAASLSKSGHIDLARLLVHPDTNVPDHGGMKWGLRRYNLGDSTVVDCDFADIPLEHGIYDNLSGHGLYQGNTFHHLGGQAIQIAYRDQSYEQYKADNLPFRGKPLLILENNHAADCGQHASRSGFTWTFFDYGTHEFPSTIILRNCTSVHAWDFTRTSGGQTVQPDHPQAMRSPGGLMVHQFQHAKEQKKGEPVTYANEFVVIDNCLFDHTLNGNPIMAIRGAETILIEDSCFLSREGRGRYVDIDDQPDRPSGRVILENCVSPPEAEVFLRIRGKEVMSMNCPGQRIEIDVTTLERTVGEPQDDEIVDLQSPLRDRRPPPGITAQPSGVITDLAALESQRAR
ncbi:hypothetical protein Poly30_27140 [Planctomycetes bacterium Poly30]|uniref:Right handed beta helix domain-containing protein n=1 Tax=Saltatorellus ferox TaxID=2528018 RepID=A0A518ET02_9BACT|nr:hypothetical protein Poly30_27140 [Planctomycetes bacterium Poly30]